MNLTSPKLTDDFTCLKVTDGPPLTHSPLCGEIPHFTAAKRCPRLDGRAPHMSSNVAAALPHPPVSTCSQSAVDATRWDLPDCTQTNRNKSSRGRARPTNTHRNPYAFSKNHQQGKRLLVDKSEPRALSSKSLPEAAVSGRTPSCAGKDLRPLSISRCCPQCPGVGRGRGPGSVLIHRPLTHGPAGCWAG